MTILTSENFDREVLNSDKPVVVDFWATWCGPCMMLSPIMEELDGEMPDVKFCKLNVDDERDLAIEYGVQSIPMLLFVKNGEIALLPQKVKLLGEEKVAGQLGIGLPTLRDVVKELMKPGRDVRDDLPAPILRTDVLDIKDLKAGMVLTGTVRNVIDFGVFVDIGVHQDGLVHISQVSSKYIKHPSEVVSVGDVVKVAVLDVDQKRGRISLTMKGVK